ncbi:MAG: hypothetical protein ABIH63_04360 [archaeon]
MESKKSNQKLFCKKLVFSHANGEMVLYGIIEFDDGEFLKFRTAKRVWTLCKSQIVLLTDTDRVFQENNEGDGR